MKLLEFNYAKQDLFNFYFRQFHKIIKFINYDPQVQKTLGSLSCSCIKEPRVQILLKAIGWVHADTGRQSLSQLQNYQRDRKPPIQCRVKIVKTTPGRLDRVKNRSAISFSRVHEVHVHDWDRNRWKSF